MRRSRSPDPCPHCAPPFASPQGLWDLSCWGCFRSVAPHPVAVEQPQSVVQPRPTPPFPAEADRLLEKVARRVDDADIMHLLKIMLKASGKRGVPQGGVISPVLSNLYLNEVDKMLERARKATRYKQYTFASNGGPLSMYST